MQRLVDDIMVLAKARRPDFVRTEPVVVSELLTGVLDKVTPLADRSWRIEASTDAIVLLDRQRVTQALVQLVANALRFTREGAVIALGGRLQGSELRLWVRDEGTGIRPEVQDRIFERFGRGPNEEMGVSNDDGVGLGLAIVAAIAAAHHGHVTLDSMVGRGSTFVLSLPASEQPLGVHALEPMAAPLPHRDPVPLDR
jgi:signal transduction histidine kinase